MHGGGIADGGWRVKWKESGRWWCVFVCMFGGGEREIAGQCGLRYSER